MDVAFKEKSLDRLKTELTFTSGFGDAIVKAYRKRLQQIRAASDERTFYAFRSLHFEKLRGREGQYSMRLNDQWRIIVELHGQPPRKTVFIVGIKDYHLKASRNNVRSRICRNVPSGGVYSRRA